MKVKVFQGNDRRSNVLRNATRRHNPEDVDLKLV